MRSTPTPGSAAPSDRAAQRLAQLASALGADAAEPDPSDHSGGTETPPEWWSDHTRVAVRDPVPAEPPEIPTPGRHAARRRGRAIADVARDRLPPVGDVGPAHLAVLALAVAVAIAGTAWWLLRDRGPVEPLPVASTGAPLIGPSVSPVVETGPAADGSASPGRAASKVTVDVVGKVRRPGIAVLAAGARVVDAIRAAGGARRGVDLSSLNLARVLVDGEQIAVGVSGAGPPVGGSAPAPAPGGGSGALVNLNTATVDQLETLPDVGPVTAQSILDWREHNGGFTSVDQLLDVDGIGDKTLAKLTPYVTV
jgi:competence protein ComEA